MSTPNTKLVLYGAIGSPPVRAVLLTLHALDLEYDFKTVDIQGGGTRTPEFLKMNPEHTVPLLDDNGHYIWDSHAINAYLVSKYAKTDALYPTDLYQRAVVDQRLFFDCGVLSVRSLKQLMSPNYTKEQKLEGIEEAYEMLEAFLGKTYLAGDSLTIADFSVLSSLTTLDALVPVDSKKTPKLAAWLVLLKKLPYYEEANGKGLAVVAAKVKELIAEKKLW